MRPVYVELHRPIPCKADGSSDLIWFEKIGATQLHYEKKQSHYLEITNRPYAH